MYLRGGIVVKTHVLKATPENVIWGHYDNEREPVVKVKSGEAVLVEVVTHHAGDAPDYMMDDEIKELYEAIPEEDRGPGCHPVTGPIYVEGVEPGDVIECRVLDMRVRPTTPYGINFQANWGLLYDDLGKEEHVTLYKVDEKTATAEAVFTYKYPIFLGTKSGIITPPESVERKPALEGVRVPLRYHIGLAATAPAEKGKINTIPPGVFGGNIDQRNWGVGDSLYLPAQVSGGQMFFGDCHSAEGDGEISGTAIETNMNILVQLIVRDDIKTESPLLETKTHWASHGLHPDLDEATRIAALEMIKFLETHKGLSKTEAYSLLSVAGDFNITQVVDQEKGVHCLLRKDIFEK
ncbi:MAG: formamidase [Clostridia bacterium]|nr:formamidase [Clostridia bacterium]